MDSLYQMKIGGGGDVVFNNALPKCFNNNTDRVKAKPKLHNGMVYRQCITMPMVLIDETDYVHKCITT